MTFRRRGRCAAVALALVAACDDPAAPLPRDLSVGILAAPDSIGIGDSFQLLATAVAPSTPGFPSTVRWTSRTPAVLAVDSSGAARGLTAGNAWVVATATRGGVADSALVRVTAGSRSLRATVARDSLATGDTVTVQTSVDETFGAPVAPGSARFVSSDPLIARVDSTSGTVTVVGDGDVTITATVGVRTAATVLHAWLRPLATAGVQLKSLALGWSFGCGLDAAGVAYCWGANAYGQLGRDVLTPGNQYQPMEAVHTATRFTSLSAGRKGVCGITTASSLECWGFILAGPTHPAETRGTPAPVALPAGAGPLLSVRMGHRTNACAIDTAGTAYCFGDNSQRNLGGTEDFVLVPRPIPGLTQPLNQVALGEVHGCGVTRTHAIWCWGFSDGWGSSSEGTAPTLVAAAGSFPQVSALFLETCSLDPQGSAWCGGVSSAAGFLPVPLARVTGVPTFVRIAANVENACGLTADGELWCWSALDAVYGSFLMPTHAPSRFSNRLRFTEFDVGAYAICGITTDGTTVCRERAPGGFQ